MTSGENINPETIRGLTQSRVSRRMFMKGAGAVAGAGALSALLAACGVTGTNPSGANPTGGNASGGTDWTSWWASKKQNGVLNFANWPYYIDTDSNGKHASLEAFTKKTGIKVNYKEVIQDDPSYYAKISPLLTKGQSIGQDIIVITDGWYLTEIINNGWAVQLDHSRMPNFTANADRSLLSPSYDPGALHSAVWQTGLTGLAYNSKKVPEGITSFADLLDPKYAGHIGLFSDNTEYGSMALLATGAQTATSTHDDWNKAVEWLNKLKPSVAKFYDQGYTDALQNGDIWISQAWSGDVYQMQQGGHPEIKFVLPTEGVITWHDNMLIPITAENPVDAITWMNYYYTPETAGIIEDYDAYICPVPAAKDYILNTLKDPAVANSPLVFPSAADLAKAQEYYTYKNLADYNAWNALFDPVAQS
ncbi:spermidine/putrescine ABC transporter substrate-binding protein [Gryllotalpicola sp.]|uniref:polyamine ABC transporter substrate-binding protein n=1 Tax=Gryllotalpicola sp. TaxID=1932787 RepID=UPI002617889F|nr:spermidine/putrescine ABC transporter substrate-binding protein [Gryllotalpicola sp.]